MKFVLLVTLLVLTSSVAAGEPVDWELIQFGALAGTPNEFTIESAVQGLLFSPASLYVSAYGSGRTWSCIAQVLDLLTRVEAEMERRDLSGDPLEVEYMYVRQHSGYRWSFWRRLAFLAEAAHELGFPVQIGTDAQRVLSEMKASFIPLLDPQRYFDDH